MFHVGQKVKCVRGPVYPSKNWTGVNQAKVGDIYTVRSIRAENRPEPNLLAVLLKEIINPVDCFGLESAFFASRFEPLTERKTDISIFKAMLNPNRKEKQMHGIEK